MFRQDFKVLTAVGTKQQKDVLQNSIYKFRWRISLSLKILI